MPKKTIREQITEVAIFVVAKHPDWVTNNLIMAYMNCSASKARDLSRSLSDTSSDFEYQNGDIRFIGDKVNWVSQSLWEDF